MTKKYFKEAARITDAFLGFEDHGFFTVILHVDYGGCSQGVGIRVLGAEGEDNPKYPMRATKAGCDFIMNVLKVCSVKSWDRLKGRQILVLFEEEFVLNAQPIGIESFAFDGGHQFLFPDFEKRAKYECDVEKRLVKHGLPTGHSEFPLNESLWVPGWKHDK